VNVLTKTILDSDVIIYDLNTAKLDEVEYAIKGWEFSFDILNCFSVENVEL